jgi:hypothetical protein
MYCLIESTCQAVMRGPSFIGAGNVQSFTFAHKVEREKGNTAKSAGSLTNPSFGNVFSNFM